MTSAFLELHAVQSVPASLLNRDETGMPKTALHGGVARDRLSSQALKAAQRGRFRSGNLVPDENLSTRTRTLHAQLTADLVTLGRTPEQAELLSANTLWGMGLLNMDPKNRTLKLTSTLLFLAASEVRSIAEKIHANADTIMTDGDTELGTLLQECLSLDQIWPVADTTDTEQPAPAPTEDGTLFDADAPAAAPAKKTASAKAKAASKKERKAACPPAIQRFAKPLLDNLDPRRAVDLALFGRFLAENNNVQIFASVCVAHALSIHEQTTTLDYYTAVDDVLKQSGYLDTGYLSAPTFYRFSVIDLRQLLTNLGGDQDLAELAVRAYVDAFVNAMPEGKKTSTAPFTRPTAVLAVLRTDQPLNLSDAFTRPVAPDTGKSMNTEGVNALTKHWDELGRAYGHGSVLNSWHLYVGPENETDELARPLPGRRLTMDDMAAQIAGQAVLHMAAS